MELNQRMYIGSRAKEILENEVFQMAFDEMEQNLWEGFRQSPLRDKEGREQIRLMLEAVTSLKAKLTSYLETGKLAELELTHQRSIVERAKNAIFSGSLES